MMKSHILVVDDDKRLRDLLKRYFLQEGNCFISTAANTQESRIALEIFVFDCLILDIMMPGGLGTELFSLPNLPPIILLSAMGEAHDRIRGLELGAHDYLTKPFEPKELSLRVSNILGRYEKKLVIGKMIYCFHRKILMKEGIGVSLSLSEGNLLHYLAMHAHETLTRKDIAAAVFPNASNERIVDVFINRLRKKIEENLEQPQYLISLRGQGYCLRTN